MTGRRGVQVGEVARVGAADPELLAGLEAGVAARLRRSLVVDVVHVEPDTAADLAALPSGLFGLLVLDGVLSRRVSIGPRASIELLGPGDVLRPWQDEHSSMSIDAGVAWRVHAPSRLALLDADFLAATTRHPTILAELASRFVQRSHALADRLAIAQIPRLDARLLALLWHLADRWGRREHGRVSIPLRLCHDTLADLACAQRPSVSLALRELRSAGRIARSPGGGWELFGAPLAERELHRPPPRASMAGARLSAG